MNTLIQPLANFLRRLFRRPRFAITVIVVLALGIGINVATLGLLYRYYLAPLPYAHGGQLVTVYAAAHDPAALAKLQRMAVTTASAVRKAAPALADAGIYDEQGYNLTLGSQERRLQGIEASASLFGTLGVRPLLGRTFGPQSSAAGAEPVVVLSYALWQSLFNGRADAIGKTLHLNGKLYTVIGVMPAYFKFPSGQAALWTARPLSPFEQSIDDLTSFNVHMVGRLAPGATAAILNTQANAVLARQLHEFGGQNPRVKAMLAKFGFRIQVLDWRGSRVGGLHESLVLALSATALLMLLVWFNLANLSLARAFAHRGEAALRRILGAGSARLLAARMAENLLLSLIGAAGGIVLAHFLLGMFMQSSVAQQVSAFGAVSWPALIVIAIVLAIISTVIFTLAGHAAVRGTQLAGALREAGARVSAGHTAHRVRKSLIVGQIALACAIGGTGLLLGRSLLNLNAVHLGFQPAHVLSFRLSFPAAQYPMGGVKSALHRLSTAIAGLSGVESVSVTSDLPLDGNTGQSVVFPHPWNPAAHPRPPLAFAALTDAGYLRTLGMSLLAGRNFLPSDAANGTTVAIIDTLAAHQIFGSENVVGREFSFQSPNADQPGNLFRVIGVVPSVRRATPAAAPSAGSVYLDFDQASAKDPTLMLGGNRDWYLAVRSPLPATRVISEVRGAAREILPGVPLYDVGTLDQRVAAALASNRLLTALVLLFAIGALILAAIGLYALQAHLVAQRVREFAVRTALGATRNRLLGLVLGEAARLLVIGLVIGLAGLAGIGIGFASAFYDIHAVDPTGMVLVAAVLTLAVLAASWFPAWRASCVQPAAALRDI